MGSSGVYGRFDFSSNKPCQIWVAGGIGITPFIARMKVLADGERRQAITLFYSTRMPDEEFISNVRALADRAKVQLRLLVTTKDDPLNAERLCQWRSNGKTQTSGLVAVQFWPRLAPKPCCKGFGYGGFPS